MTTVAKQIMPPMVRCVNNVLWMAFIFFVFLTACSSNTSRGMPPQIPPSNPTFRSQFLFITGDYHYRIGDLHGADYLLREAWKSDPQSRTLMKHLLSVNADRYHQGWIDAALVTGLIDTLLVKTVFDEEMLIMAIEVFSKIPDPLRQSELIDLYIRRYPHANAYIRKLIYEFDHEGTINLKLMDRIRSLAGNDAGVLFYLARIYSITEIPPALDLLRQIHRFTRMDEAEDLLIMLTVKHADIAEIVNLFRSYRMPDDRRHLLALVAQMMDYMKYDAILKLENDLLALKEVDFLLPLALAAFDTDKIRTFDRVLNAVETLPAPPDGASMVFALAAIRAMNANDYGKTRKYIAKLPSLSDLRLICHFYIHDWLNRNKKTFSNLGVQERRDLAAAFDKLPAHVVPPPIRDYLSVTLHIILLDEPLPDKTNERQIGYNCARYLWDKGFHHPDQIEELQKYYFLNRNHDALVPILRLAIELYPYDAGYLNNLGYFLLIGGGDFDEAGELISKSLYIEPNDPHTLDSMAWYHYLKGDFATALEWMTVPAALEDLPGEVAYHLAMIHHALGNIKESVYYLKKTVEINDDETKSRLAREMLEILSR